MNRWELIGSVLVFVALLGFLGFSIWQMGNIIIEMFSQIGYVPVYD